MPLRLDVESTRDLGLIYSIEFLHSSPELIHSFLRHSSPTPGGICGWVITRSPAGRCGRSISSGTHCRSCPDCGGEIEFHYELAHVRLDRPLPGIWRFIDLLPLSDPSEIVSLGEGNTPLLPARLSIDLGCELSWKWEGINPTGAQKDRGLAVAIAKGRSFGFASAIIASTGSAGLASAAYAARAGLRHAVLVSRNAPPERVIPMAILGSTIFEVDGTIEDTLELLAQPPASSVPTRPPPTGAPTPTKARARRRSAYEIFLQHGSVPDWIVIPVGGGGTLASIWRGFRDLRDLGLIDRMPGSPACNQPTTTRSRSPRRTALRPMPICAGSSR